MKPKKKPGKTRKQDVAKDAAKSGATVTRTADRDAMPPVPNPHNDGNDDEDGLQLMLRIEIPIDNLANIGSDEEFVYAEADQLDRILLGSLDELVEYLYAVAEEGNFLPPYRSSMFARRVGQA